MSLRDALVEVLEARDHVLDVIADAIVIGHERFPVHRGALAQRRAREPATIAGSLRSCWLAGSRMPREGLMMPIESSTVTNCSPPACTSISERPRHGRMSAISPVMRCERFSLVETCAVSRQRCSAFAVNSVSGVAERKLPPMPTKMRMLPSCMCLIVSTVSMPCLRRRREVKLLAELVHELVVHPLPDAHGAIALHIRVAAHRARARAGAADVPAEQEEIHDLLDRADGVLVLRQAHRPADDDALRLHRDLRGLADLFARQAAAQRGFRPRRARAQMLR